MVKLIRGDGNMTSKWDKNDGNWKQKVTETKWNEKLGTT